MDNLLYQNLAGLEGEALLFPEGEVSYRELAQLTRARIDWLQAQNPSAIAFLGEKTRESVALILAALYCEIPFCPLDPTLPPARREKIFSLLGSALWVDNPSLAPSASADFAPKTFAPNRVALLLQTSGSTGDPKVVQISSGGLLHFLRWAIPEIDLKATDTFAQLSSFSFDMFTLELFAPLLVGGAIAFPPAAASAFPASLHRWLGEKNVTALYAVPTTIQRISGVPRPLPHLRLLISAGDRFPDAALREISARQKIQAWNFYGPTETNVCSSHRWSESSPVHTPIGSPITATEFLLQPVDGAPEGWQELLVSGPTVMAGYQGEHSGLRELNGKTYFPTGDLAKRAGDEYILSSRIDRLVKVHGYRVHPEELARFATEKFPSHHWAALALPVESGHQIILACEGTPPESALAGIRASLPRPLWPEEIVGVERFPLNQNGKVDAKRLSLILRG